MIQRLFDHSRLIQAAIAAVTIATASPAYSAPKPNPVPTKAPNLAASTLGNVITPNCKNHPFPFPAKECSTGDRFSLDRDDLNEVQRQINDRVQRLRQNAESGKILVPFIQITF